MRHVRPSGRGAEYARRRARVQIFPLLSRRAPGKRPGRPSEPGIVQRAGRALRLGLCEPTGRLGAVLAVLVSLNGAVIGAPGRFEPKASRSL
jgi:hypothetical protein